MISKLVVAIALVSALSMAVTAQLPERSGSIEGLWGAVHAGGPRVQGELTIRAANGGYLASIAGYEAAVTGTGAELRFALPQAGEFRGGLDADRNGISGHWIQPRGPVSFQPRATPVHLRLRAPGVWSGVVAPLQERLSIFVDIRRDAESLTAVVRIPETNWWGNQRLTVQVDGDQLLLKGPPDIRGRYDARADRLLLSVVDDQPQAFSRRTPDAAVGFYARSPRQAAYTYRPPADAGDGWATTTLRAAGLDDRPLVAFIQSILEADGSDPATIPVHSVIVARRGRLAMEEYFYGFERDRPHDSRSAGKTFAPLLVGIARDRGAKLAPDTPLAGLVPRYRPFANDDARKQRLTLEDVMTMRSGLACDDNDPMAPGGEDRMQRQRDQLDWYKYTVDLPMVGEPGGATPVYCSASLNLAGGVASAASGMWNADLFQRHVARPLQFGTYHLNLIPTGDAYFGGGVYLRPRDALKLGQLYLNGGVWNGTRVIGKDWVERSTKSYGTFVRPDWDPDHGYGYGWHVHRFTVGGRTYRQFAAEGNGGQLVMVFPDLDMVVGINAGKYGSAAWYRWALDIIPKYLIPAAANGR